jgi:UDP-glucose 6-dehydrogenase
MKIGVAGLWHLGVMYAVGFAELGHLVIAYDPNADSISDLIERARYLTVGKGV